MKFYVLLNFCIDKKNVVSDNVMKWRYNFLYLQNNDFRDDIIKKTKENYMKLSEYKAGQWVNQYHYKSFYPKIT